MLLALYIFVDAEFGDPIYAEPDAADLEPDSWVAVCEAVTEALEGDRDANGVAQIDEAWLGWRVITRAGMAFVAIVSDDVKQSNVTSYLQRLSRNYLDEVDDPRNPERDGVEDVVVEVVPPWEDDED